MESINSIPDTDIFQFLKESSRFSPNLQAYSVVEGETSASIRAIAQQVLRERGINNVVSFAISLGAARNMLRVQHDNKSLGDSVFLHFSMNHGETLYALLPALRIKVPICWRYECKSGISSANAQLTCRSCFEKAIKKLDVISVNYSLTPLNDLARRISMPKFGLLAWKEHLLNEYKSDLPELHVRKRELRDAVVALLVTEMGVDVNVEVLTDHMMAVLKYELQRNVFKFRYVKLSHCPENDAIIFKFPDYNDWARKCELRDCYSVCIGDLGLCRHHSDRVDGTTEFTPILMRLLKIDDWADINEDCITQLRDRIDRNGGALLHENIKIGMNKHGCIYFTRTVGSGYYRGGDSNYLCESIALNPDCQRFTKPNASIEFWFRCPACRVATLKWKVVVVTTIENNICMYAVLIVPTTGNKTKLCDRAVSSFFRRRLRSSSYVLLWESDTLGDGTGFDFEQAKSTRIAVIMCLLIIAYHSKIQIQIANSNAELCLPSTIASRLRTLLTLCGLTVNVVHSERDIDKTPANEQWGKIISPAATYRPDPLNFSSTVYAIIHEPTKMVYVGEKSIYTHRGRGDHDRDDAKIHHVQENDTTNARLIPIEGRHTRTLMEVSRPTIAGRFQCETLAMMAFILADGWVINGYQCILTNLFTSSFTFRCTSWFSELQRFMMVHFGGTVKVSEKVPGTFTPIIQLERSTDRK